MSETPDYFLKIDGIEGESQDLKHKGELNVLSFSRGAISPRDVGTGGAAAATTWDDARFTMRVDKSFPKLLETSLKNLLVKNAILVCRKAGGTDAAGKTQPGQEFLKITFSEVMISSCRLLAPQDDDATPIVEFSLNYTKITEEYRAQTATGTLSGTVSFSHSLQGGSGGA